MNMQRSWLLAALVLTLSVPGLLAETCMSPFVKRLNRQEKYLYVYSVNAGKKGPDRLFVIDVDPKSRTWGTVLGWTELPGENNEPHHFGFTDDRTHIWGCCLFSHKIFIIDVTTDPAKPRVIKTIDTLQTAGYTGPHTPYALPGRMLITFLGGKDEKVPTGMAEYRNDGTFIRSIHMPREAPYGYDVAVSPDLNRMVTSSFTPPSNYRNQLAKMDFKNFGDKLVFWDFRKREPIQILTAGAAPLECRWSVKGKDFGFTNCALDDSVWVWEGDGKGKYKVRQLFKTGKLPVDLRQSADDRFLFVSCFVGDEIQMWDVSHLQKPKMVSSLKPGVQPNMMHLTGDGKRMYLTNSLLSTMDRSTDYWVKLAEVSPEGMKLHEKFLIDLGRIKDGPFRGHDMLLN